MIHVYSVLAHLNVEESLFIQEAREPYLKFLLHRVLSLNRSDALYIEIESQRSLSRGSPAVLKGF